MESQPFLTSGRQGTSQLVFLFHFLYKVLTLGMPQPTKRAPRNKQVAAWQEIAHLFGAESAVPSEATWLALDQPVEFI